MRFIMEVQGLFVCLVAYLSSNIFGGSGNISSDF
jgi:hypothetical protein